MAQNKRKILFVITKSNIGGAQRNVLDIATHLPKDQYEVAVAYGPAQGSEGEGQLGEKLRTEGIRTIFLSSLARDVGLGDAVMFGALLKLFRQEKPDIVHLHSSKVGALGSLAARIARVPRIVFTAHGWAFRESRNFLTRLIIWKISLLTVLMCHTTICVSEKDRRAFRLLGKKVVTIHNEVPMRSDILFRDDARAALGIKSNADKIIGVVAELSANKNVALSIESVASAREAGAHLQLIIMGDGEERTELQKKALEIQPKSAITFLGTVPDAAKYLHAFDALILPSKKEGLPYIILEAHQASVPVIASDTGGVSEITNENDTLCPVDDKRCFVAALKAVTQASPMKLMNSNFEKMIASTIKTYL